MPWVKIDDHFDEHPKMQKVGPIGWGFWLAGLAYCNRNLTDGFIPWSKARTLCSFEIVEDDGMLWELGRNSGHAGEGVTSDWVIGLLIDAGLWEEVSNGNGRIDGYRIHDYPEYQPTKAQVEEERAKKVAAGQAGGQASAQARAQARAQAKPNQTLKQNPTAAQAKSNPVPDPVPVPTSFNSDELKEITPIVPNFADTGEYPEDFERDFWRHYPKGRGGKLKAFQHWKKMSPAQKQAAMNALPEFQAGSDWIRGFYRSPDIWLKDRLWENPPPPMVIVYPEPIRIRMDRWDAESIETGVSPKDRPYPPQLLEAMAEYRESLRNGRKNGAAS